MKARARTAAAADRPGREPDYRALAELRHHIRRFLTFSERAARAAGIEPQQHQLLLAIKGLPSDQRPTVGVLAERLQVRHHTAVGLADRLAASGLAARRASASDGREILLHITARGERLLHRLSLAHRAELETAGPALAEALGALVGPRRAPGPTRRLL
jgi:DNA-binding MarR family transcriptional regulator